MEHLADCALPKRRPEVAKSVNTNARFPGINPVEMKARLNCHWTDTWPVFSTAEDPAC